MFQINQQNRKETEDQIRCALKSLMKPEEDEDELRKAIEGTAYILGQQSTSPCFLLLQNWFKPRYFIKGCSPLVGCGVLSGTRELESLWNYIVLWTTSFSKSETQKFKRK